MEISEREYHDLRMQVQMLQAQVGSMGGPRRTTVKDLVREQLISGVTNLESHKPVFGYSRHGSDAWLQMLALAKLVHGPSNLFYMDKAYSYDRCHSTPYIRTLWPKNGARKVADLTPDQINTSVQMLDELIPIYNRYFKMLHQRVMYDPTGRGDYEPVGVLDDQLLEEDET